MPPRRIDLLVEDESQKAALDVLMPRLLPAPVGHAVQAFAGKEDLLHRLEEELRHRRTPLAEGRIGCVVLVDLDAKAGEPCSALKRRLEDAAARAGVPTKAAPGAGGRFAVTTRIAVDELESWFLGDADALRGAYPGMTGDVAARRHLRDPEAVPGGASEALHRLIVDARGRRVGKVARAAAIAAHMEAGRNRAPSFHAFVDGVEALLGQGPGPPRRAAGWHGPTRTR